MKKRRGIDKKQKIGTFTAGVHDMDEISSTNRENTTRARKKIRKGKQRNNQEESA